jgi:azurin
VQRARAAPGRAADSPARKVSGRSGIQVARRRIQVGMTHAGKTVTIELAETTARVTDASGELLATVQS